MEVAVGLSQQRRASWIQILSTLASLQTSLGQGGRCGLCHAIRLQLAEWVGSTTSILPRAARAAAIGAPPAADLEGERRQMPIPLGCSARLISASHPGFAQLALELFTPFLLLAAASLKGAARNRSSSAFGCAARSV